MITAAEDSLILDKTLELCETITSHRSFLTLRQPIETFLKNEAAMEQYNSLVELAQFLDHRQSTGTAITPDEAKNFEGVREKTMNNPIIRDFLESRQKIEAVKQVIQDCVSKTFELGRKPTVEELNESEGSCGSGCGCH